MFIVHILKIIKVKVIKSEIFSLYVTFSIIIWIAQKIGLNYMYFIVFNSYKYRKIPFLIPGTKSRTKKSDRDFVPGKIAKIYAKNLFVSFFKGDYSVFF